MARVYLDSCIVIYLIQGSEELSDSVRSALAPTDRESPTVCLSDLTRLECRVGPMKHRNAEILQAFDDFFASEDIERVPLAAAAFDLASEMRAAHQIKTPDALHLAAAILAGCAEFWTNDLRLKSAAQGRITLNVFPLAFLHDHLDQGC